MATLRRELDAAYYEAVEKIEQARRSIDNTAAQLGHLKGLKLRKNPLNPELAAANKQGLDAVKASLRAKAAAQIMLNEAKLILVGEWMSAADTATWEDDATTLKHGRPISAQGAILRELHALLKARDPGFGGLVRVMNKRQEFLWVHEKFAGEY
jgi:hypothetical protein